MHPYHIQDIFPPILSDSNLFKSKWDFYYIFLFWALLEN